MRTEQVSDPLAYPLAHLLHPQTATGGGGGLEVRHPGNPRASLPVRAKRRAHTHAAGISSLHHPCMQPPMLCPVILSRSGPRPRIRRASPSSPRPRASAGNRAPMDTRDRGLAADPPIPDGSNRRHAVSRLECPGRLNAPPIAFTLHLTFHFKN